MHIDASSLSEAKHCSRADGHFFLNTMSTNPLHQPHLHDTMPPNNDAILTNSTVVKPVLSSSAISELGALFFNLIYTDLIRTSLIEMGHTYHPTPLTIDDSSASCIANNNIKQLRSKYVGMSFYLVQKQVNQNHFCIFYWRDANNLNDYTTKHHPVIYHINMCPVYLHTPKVT